MKIYEGEQLFACFVLKLRMKCYLANGNSIQENMGTSAPSKFQYPFKFNFNGVGLGDVIFSLKAKKLIRNADENREKIT